MSKRRWSAVLLFVLVLGACRSAGPEPVQAVDPGEDEVQELDQVTLDLAFLMDGSKAPLVLGKEQGFFLDEGIDLTLVEGTGSSNTVQAVGNKRYEFGLPGGQATATAVGAGVPIKMIANHMPRDQLVIFVREESPIQTLKDLEGRRLVVGIGQQSTVLVREVLEAAGADVDLVEIEEVQEEGKNLLFLQGRYDATATPFESIAVMRQAEPDLELRAFPYAEYGYGSMSSGLATHVDTIENNPGLVSRMVAAYARSYLYAAENKEELIDVVSHLYPAATPDVLSTEYDIAFALVATEHTEGQPFGWMAPEDWESTLELLRRTGDIDDDVSPEDIYTNEFIGDWEHLPPQGEFGEQLGGGS